MPSFCCIWMTQMLDGTAESGRARRSVKCDSVPHLPRPWCGRHDGNAPVCAAPITKYGERLFHGHMARVVSSPKWKFTPTSIRAPRVRGRARNATSGGAVHGHCELGRNFAGRASLLCTPWTRPPPTSVPHASELPSSLAHAKSGTAHLLNHGT